MQRNHHSVFVDERRTSQATPSAPQASNNRSKKYLLMAGGLFMICLYFVVALVLVGDKTAAVATPASKTDSTDPRVNLDPANAQSLETDTKKTSLKDTVLDKILPEEDDERSAKNTKRAEKRSSPQSDRAASLAKKKKRVVKKLRKTSESKL